MRALSDLRTPTMDDQFVSYDTFSISSEMPTDHGAPPVLARLPYVPSQTKRSTRHDAAEPGVPTAHLHEAAETLSTDNAASTTTTIGGAPATIRIDTFNPVGVADTSAVSEPPPKERAVLLPGPPAPPEAEAEEEAAWLLRAEAAIQPYSRWIALLAVLAALGLTVLLLRGGASARDSETETPQLLIEASQPIAQQEAPFWPEEPEEKAAAAPPVTSSEAIAQSEPEQVATEALAVGPASAPRAQPQAELTGEVLPVTPERINVADSSVLDPYPTTNR